jgi:four helix bundle protein
MTKSINDLKVYEMAYRAAMEIFETSKSFPPEEKYSLTDQIRRSSRSVPINLREGFAKRKYKNVFIRQINDALGSSEETRGWLAFANDCKYIDKAMFDKMDKRCDDINAMLYRLMENWF